MLQILSTAGFYKHKMTETDEYGHKLPFVGDDRFNQIRFEELNNLLSTVRFNFLTKNSAFKNTVEFC